MHNLQACLLKYITVSAFMLCIVKMPLKVVVGGRVLNGHGNYIVDHGKSWKNHGIVFLNFCGNPVKAPQFYTNYLKLKSLVMDSSISEVHVEV